MERGIQSMSDAHGLCLQDFVSANTNNGNANDHLHNHHNLHDSVSSAVSVSSAITGLMSSGNNSLNHLSHDTSNHHHHHHSLSNTPALHEPLEKLKCKCFVRLLSFQFLERVFPMKFLAATEKNRTKHIRQYFGWNFCIPFHGYLNFLLHIFIHVKLNVRFSTFVWWVAIVCLTSIAGHPNHNLLVLHF